MAAAVQRSWHWALWGLLIAFSAAMLLLSKCYLYSDSFSSRAVDTGGSDVVPAGIQHILVVVEENHAYEGIIGNRAEAPYLNDLAARGALFTRAYAVEHPSQPNYLDLFAGGNLGVTDDGCFAGYVGRPNLAESLVAHGYGFRGYSEGLPAAGSAACGAGSYARKHNPWSDFLDLDQSTVNLPFTDFPSDFDALPAVAFVIPSQTNDMHSGSVRTADAWLRAKLGAYETWAATHASLLIVTWDEDDSLHGNHVPLIVAGAFVKTGSYSQAVNHYSVLRFIESAFSLPFIGASATASPLGDIWEPGR